MKGRSSKVLLFGALLSCLILIIAGKSSKMTVYASEAKLVQGEAVQYMGYSTHYYYVNGNLAYCLEPDMASPGNGNYPSEEIDDAIAGEGYVLCLWGPGYEAYMKPSLNGAGISRNGHIACPIAYCPTFTTDVIRKAQDLSD